jgi:hypothetical protein
MAGFQVTTHGRFSADHRGKKEVHDLDNEKTGCQIDDIIKAKHDKPYTSQSAANAAGYDNCAHCLGGSKR